MDAKKPNINFNDMLTVTFNTDNMRRYFEYLDLANSQSQRTMEDLKIRIQRVEENPKQLDDIMTKVNASGSKIDDIYSTLNSYQSKFMEIEVKTELLNEVRLMNNLRNLS